MPPSFASDHIESGALGNGVFNRQRPQCLSGSVSSSHVPHSILRKISASSLFRTIDHVIHLGSEKQVVGTNTRGIVAVMQDVHVFRHGSEMNYPRNSVGENVRRMFAALAATSGNTSISLYSRFSRPFPAVGCFLDIAPESFCEGSIFNGLVTDLTAVFSYFIRKRGKYVPTF